MERPAHIPVATDRAYRETAFIVSVDGCDIVIRVGSMTPALDALLTRQGADEWAFLTASNPHPAMLTPAENEARNQALRRDVSSLGFPMVRGRGEGREGWMEESVLAFGMPATDAMTLGRKYGQAACVTGRRGGPALLLYCD